MAALIAAGGEMAHDIKQNGQNTMVSARHVGRRTHQSRKLMNAWGRRLLLWHRGERCRSKCRIVGHRASNKLVDPGGRRNEEKPRMYQALVEEARTECWSMVPAPRADPGGSDQAFDSGMPSHSGRFWLGHWFSKDVMRQCETE